MSLVQRFWLTLVAVLTVVVLVLALVGTRLVAGSPLTPAGAPAGPADGAAGIGDDYLPDAGGGGYDVQHYDVSVTAGAPDDELRGTTTITAQATQNLDRLHLDLYLTATSATVNGTPATLEQSGDDLSIQAVRPDAAAPAIRAGQVFTVTVEYAGYPERIRARGTPAYYRKGAEFVIAGEPRSATLWYPANDHPRDAATMQFTVSVPKGSEAVCSGRLLTHGTDPSDAARERWVWQVDSPTVTYATFLSVGQFKLEQGVADGRPYVYAVSEQLSAADQAKALQWLRGTPAVIDKLEQYLGPYPFSGAGGFVAATDFYWSGLETAMRPVYDNKRVGSQSLLNHELAHMWLGNTVTLTQWNDIFDNESLTSYVEWLTTPRDDPAGIFSYFYNGQANRSGFWGPPLSDPGRNQLFERVYDRGPMVVHALRTRMGDEAFFALLKGWAQQQGPRSLEDFRRQADDATPENLSGFFAEWLDQPDRPDATRENGVVR